MSSFQNLWVIVNKKPLNLEKTKSIVLSVLLLFYDNILNFLCPANNKIYIKFK